MRFVEMFTVTKLEGHTVHIYEPNATIKPTFIVQVADCNRNKLPHCAAK